MDEEYWEQIEQEQEKVEISEHNYIDEYLNEGYFFTMNRIQSNNNGGKRSGAE